MIKHLKFYILPLILLMPKIAIGDTYNPIQAISTILAAGVVQSDSSGNLFSSPTTQVTNIEATSGQTFAWPTNIGVTGNFLGVDGGNQLIWTVPGGGGDVSSLSNFGATSHIITSSGTGKNVQVTLVTIDDSGNMAGIGTLGATTVNATTFNGALTGHASLDLPLTGNSTMSGPINMGGQAITGAGAVTSTGFNGPLTGTVTGHATLDLPLTGNSTMSGPINMGGQGISNISTVTATNFYGNLTGTVTGHASLDLPLTGGTMSGDIAMGDKNISGVEIITTNTAVVAIVGITKNIIATAKKDFTLALIQSYITLDDYDFFINFVGTAVGSTFLNVTDNFSPVGKIWWAMNNSVTAISGGFLANLDPGKSAIIIKNSPSTYSIILSYN